MYGSFKLLISDQTGLISGAKATWLLAEFQWLRQLQVLWSYMDLGTPPTKFQTIYGFPVDSPNRPEDIFQTPRKAGSSDADGAPHIFPRSVSCAPRGFRAPGRTRFDRIDGCSSAMGSRWLDRFLWGYHMIFPPNKTGWWLGHPSEKYEFVNWDD